LDYRGQQSFSLPQASLNISTSFEFVDFTQPIVIECDACGVAIGAILTQQDRPIAYFSQALKGSTLTLST